MGALWKRKPALGLGLGVGLVGAVSLALRYALHRPPRQPIPDSISPAIFATRVADTSLGEIVYHTSGAGEPLFFLHGIYPGASSFEWSRVYPEFAVGYEVVAPDLIGFGESERPRQGLDADGHVQALADLVRNLCGSRPVSVVASGFGAALALKLAVQHPELVRRLILLAPVGLDASVRRLPTGFATLARLPGLNRFVYKNYLARRPFIRGWVSKFGFADETLATDEIVDVLVTFAGQYGAEHAMLAFLRGRLLYDVKSQLQRVTQPVAVLWPTLPDRFPEDLPGRLRGAIRDYRIVPAGPMGPLGALETPDHVRGLIEAELARDIPLSGAA